MLAPVYAPFKLLARFIFPLMFAVNVGAFMCARYALSGQLFSLARHKGGEGGSPSLLQVLIERYKSLQTSSKVFAEHY